MKEKFGFSGKSGKDYKKCCYLWTGISIVFFLLFMTIYIYPHFFRLVYGSSIKTEKARLVLPEDFFFVKNNEILKNGIKQIGEVYLEYSIWSGAIIYDISDINYDKIKEIWFKNYKCYIQNKKWQGYKVEEILFSSPDFKECEFIMVAIPDLNMVITFYDYRVISVFLNKAKLKKR